MCAKSSQKQKPETDNSPAFPSSASCRSCPGCCLDLHPLLLPLPAALCLWVRVKTNNRSVENVTVVTKATVETRTTQWSLFWETAPLTDRNSKIPVLMEIHSLFSENWPRKYSDTVGVMYFSLSSRMVPAAPELPEFCPGSLSPLLGGGRAQRSEREKKKITFLQNAVACSRRSGGRSAGDQRWWRRCCGLLLLAFLLLLQLCLGLLAASIHLFGHPAHTIFLLWKTQTSASLVTLPTQLLLWKTQASASLVTLPTQHFCYEKHRHLPVWAPCPHNTFVMKNTGIYLFGHPAHTFLLWSTPVSTSLVPWLHTFVMENTGVHLFGQPVHINYWVTLSAQHFSYGKHWCPPLSSPCPHNIFFYPAHTFLLWKTLVSTSLVKMPTQNICYGKHQCPPLWSPCPHIISIMENSSIYLFGHPAHTSFLLLP